MTLADDIGLPAMEEELLDRLQALVDAVVSTGRPAAIGIVVKIKPMERGDGVTIDARVKATEPKRQADAGPWVQHLYRADDGGLTMKDPKQPPLWEVAS